MRVLRVASRLDQNPFDSRKFSLPRQLRDSASINSERTGTAGDSKRESKRTRARDGLEIHDGTAIPVGRDNSRVVLVRCNSLARSLYDEARGEHDQQDWSQKSATAHWQTGQRARLALVAESRTRRRRRSCHSRSSSSRTPLVSSVASPRACFLLIDARLVADSAIPRCRTGSARTSRTNCGNGPLRHALGLHRNAKKNSERSSSISVRTCTARERETRADIGEFRAGKLREGVTSSRRIDAFACEGTVCARHWSHGMDTY